MTLLERTQSLTTRAKQRREHDLREEVAKHIRARTKNLEKHLQQLETAWARAEALDRAGRQRSPWPAPPVVAFDAYEQKGGAPISVESTRQEEWDKFVVALGKFVKKAEEAIAQDIKRARQDALEDNLLEDLHTYLHDPSTERQAQDLLGILRSLQEKRWETLSGADLGAVLQKARDFCENVVRLRETGSSEDLRRFLALARKDGAPLEALTDPLRAELETRKLLGRLRLTLR
ncbi:hypothetical protein [Sorangium sp. So ce145]|uniref:hypothetical protein n=1 Tax=Sorangium sp. So ce145 TaxID=3133285 RepID=UPI003F647640